MRADRFFLCFFAAVTLFAGCKDDSGDEEEKLYLSGTLKFQKDIPEYVVYGYQQDISFKGAYHPDAAKKADGTYEDMLGYYVVDPITSKTDTIKRFEAPVDSKYSYTFKVSKDTLATFSFTGSAYAPGYYANSCSAKFTIVKPGYGEGCSIKGFDTETDKEELAGKTYHVTTICGKKWIRQNYADPSSGVSYKNCEVMDDIFGRFYTWEEAKTVCPKGWRLPTSAEFDGVVASAGGVGALMADIYFNGTKPSNKMWTYWPEVGKLTDATKLSVMPVGYATITDGDCSFYDLNSRAVFWTDDEELERGVARYLYEEKNVLYKGVFDKTSFAASVRCVEE